MNHQLRVPLTGNGKAHVYEQRSGHLVALCSKAPPANESRFSPVSHDREVCNRCLARLQSAWRLATAIRSWRFREDGLSIVARGK